MGIRVNLGRMGSANGFGRRVPARGPGRARRGFSWRRRRAARSTHPTSAREQVAHVVGPHGASEEVSLALLGAEITQDIALPGFLDALRHGVEPQGRAE